MAALILVFAVGSRELRLSPMLKAGSNTTGDSFESYWISKVFCEVFCELWRLCRPTTRNLSLQNLVGR